MWQQTHLLDIPHASSAGQATVDCCSEIQTRDLRPPTWQARMLSTRPRRLVAEVVILPALILACAQWSYRSLLVLYLPLPPHSVHKCIHRSLREISLSDFALWSWHLNFSCFRIVIYVYTCAWTTCLIWIINWCGHQTCGQYTSIRSKCHEY